MARVGVFICHCGLNIAGTVDVGRVAEAARGIPDVVEAVDYVYLCSEPGQALIQDAIRAHGLDAVVVAACSPAMHEPTFRRAAAAAGLNPYRLEIANIREQISWPHQREPHGATQKAIGTVRSIVAKVRRDEALVPLATPVARQALVIGGGIAGITAALSIAQGGRPVVLVERSQSLGGHARELAEGYLDAGNSGDLLERRICELLDHPLIEVLVGTEVTAFSGYVGKFTATISRANGEAAGRGGSAEDRQVNAGAVILATGFDLYGTEHFPEYGGGRYPNVVNSLRFEEMLREGTVRRPHDGRPARDVVWIQCAGSRDPHQHKSYCSKICCMYVAKQAIAFRRASPQGQAYVFYIDIRSQGRGYDEFVQSAMEDHGVVYLRGKVSKVVQNDDHVEVWGADTLSGRGVRVRADLVVLANAAVPSRGSDALARIVRAPTDESGFFAEAHPKLRPVESPAAGIYLAGAAQFPKDLPETIAHASGAAAKVLQLLSQEQMVYEPTVAVVEEELCAGCGRCVPACPYEARSLHRLRPAAVVNAALCQSCGACVVACPNKATSVRNDTPEQVLATIEGLLED